MEPRRNGRGRLPLPLPIQPLSEDRRTLIAGVRDELGLM